MKTKTVSQLDADGYFVGPTAADESPLEPGVFLIPGGAVDVEPPVVPDGYRARWSNGWAFEAIPQPEPLPAAVPQLPPETQAVQNNGAVPQTDPVERLRAFLAANPDVLALLN